MASNNDPSTVAAISLVRGYVPEFEVINKSESRLHRTVGWILDLFDGNYLHWVWTTIGYKAARPLQVEKHPWPEWSTILHEGWHAVQARRLTRPGFMALYAFPQIVGVLALVLAPVLATLTDSWWPFLGLLCLAPFPAPWRAYAELEAYMVSAAIDCWLWGHFPDEAAEHYASHFCSGTYYFMLPFRRLMRRHFLRWSQDVLNERWRHRIKNHELEQYMLDVRDLTFSLSD